MPLPRYPRTPTHGADYDMVADASKGSSRPTEQSNLHEKQNNARTIPSLDPDISHDKSQPCFLGSLDVVDYAIGPGIFPSFPSQVSHQRDRPPNPASSIPQLLSLKPQLNGAEGHWLPSSDNESIYTSTESPHPQTTSKRLSLANGTVSDSSSAPPLSTGDIIHHGFAGEFASPGLMDNPDFRDFLDTIPESDPTTLQSLLPKDCDSEGGLPNQLSLFSLGHKSKLIPGEVRKPANHNDKVNTIPAVSAAMELAHHGGPPELANGKRKLPSLQQMRADNCIFRLYGENQGRRQKRHKMKGRQCTRCRLKNLKVSICMYMYQASHILTFSY